MNIALVSEAEESACAQEPIRVPGSIQPHGALFVVSPNDLLVEQFAADPALAATVEFGKPLANALPALRPFLEQLGSRLPSTGSIQLGVVESSSGQCQIIAHRAADRIIVELERLIEQKDESFETLYPKLREFVDELQLAPSLEAAMARAASEVRRLSGLDRALIYQFDEEWNGAVVAEDRNETLPSYLGLRFPASDIPAQARDLYRLNRLRLIPDATYSPIQIKPQNNPSTGQPVDLSFAVLRSVSPVHLEYMRNMGTAASMSVSLVVNNRLWGLISCHNKAPAFVGYAIRSACDFIGQILSMQIASHESAYLAQERNSLRSVQTRLLAHMSGANHFVEGLIRDQADVLALTKASGAAIISGDACSLIGATPFEADVKALANWLTKSVTDDVWQTDSLASLWPDAHRFKDTASGVLAISISKVHRSFVLWFRPEVIRTVTWGGDPNKNTDPKGNGRLNPRKSFENWQETVRLRSQSWRQAEAEAAEELRSAIVDIVLRKAEELAALSERLQAINKELEAFSYSVSHDLRAPFRHIVGYAQLLKKAEGSKLSDKGNRFIDTIVESAISAGTLVDNLLSFSQMGRATLRHGRVNMDAIIADVRKQLIFAIGDRKIEWDVGPLGEVWADPTMMRLVVQNLLENAIKFTKDRTPAHISVKAERTSTEVAIHVTDDGAGFDMAYVGKLFGVFQRLHRAEEFEGTGIGLANVKRILERHGGRVWAKGEVNKGATLSFALPLSEEN